MSKIYQFRFLILIVFIGVAFLLGGQLGWNWGHEEGLKESKYAIEQSMELYNLGETKYIELARETADGKEANPEFVQKLWDIKNRQDILLKDVWEYAKKLGINTRIENIPFKEE